MVSEMKCFSQILKGECKRKEDERKAIQSQLEDSQQLNQTLKDSVLEMKKEQRLVLDELETQLSSLIEEKQTLEERQGVIGHSLVPKPLTFKTRLSAKPFL